MQLAWKEIMQNKVRYFLVSTIMTAVLFLVFFITALSNGLGYSDSAAMSRLDANQVILNMEADGVLIKSALTESDVDAISKQLNEPVSPFSLTISSLERDNATSVDVEYFTVDFNLYKVPQVVEGKPLSELGKGEVLADESLKKFNYSLGDTIKDSRTGKEMRIAGFTKDHIYSFMPVIFVNLDMGFQSLYSGKASYNAVLAKDTDVSLSGYDIQTVKETVKTMPGYSETQMSFSVMKSFLIIISVFVSSVFFYVITIQKIHQFGFLKAIGTKTTYIAKAILMQVGMLTLLGLAIAGLAFYGIVQVLPEEMPFVLSQATMVWTGILFVVLNMAGALLSVFKVVTIDPLEAMGRVE